MGQRGIGKGGGGGGGGGGGFPSNRYIAQPFLRDNAKKKWKFNPIS